MLETLGLVETDYKHLTITFRIEVLCILYRDLEGRLRRLALRLFIIKSIRVCKEWFFFNSTKKPSTITYPPEIKSLLDEFAEVFASNTSIPSKRQHDRALNKITIKDKYPIPVINELLEELYGAKFFLKLDLLLDYHQIHVKEDEFNK